MAFTLQTSIYMDYLRVEEIVQMFYQQVSISSPERIIKSSDLCFLRLGWRDQNRQSIRERRQIIPAEVRDWNNRLLWVAAIVLEMWVLQMPRMPELLQVLQMSELLQLQVLRMTELLQLQVL
jgi:hypothetical protein